MDHLELRSAFLDYGYSGIVPTLPVSLIYDTSLVPMGI